MDALTDPAIRAAIRQAWEDSLPNSPQRHEEGGYIVQNADRSLEVLRWPRGDYNSSDPPLLDSNNCFLGKQVVAAFHTHPNPPGPQKGNQFVIAIEEPSPDDVIWHEEHKLKGFVIGWNFVFEIAADGTVSVVGRREDVL